DEPRALEQEAGASRWPRMLAEVVLANMGGTLGETRQTAELLQKDRAVGWPRAQLHYQSSQVDADHGHHGRMAPVQSRSERDRALRPVEDEFHGRAITGGRSQFQQTRKLCRLEVRLPNVPPDPQSLAGAGNHPQRQTTRKLPRFLRRLRGRWREKWAAGHLGV